MTVFYRLICKNIFFFCFSANAIFHKITEKKEEFYSLLVFKDINARHSGKYTCYASNAAAKVNYTAELQVRGKVPRNQKQN